MNSAVAEFGHDASRNFQSKIKNSIDPDETSRAVSSRSTLFAEVPVLVCKGLTDYRVSR